VIERERGAERGGKEEEDEHRTIMISEGGRRARFLIVRRTISIEKATFGDVMNLRNGYCEDQSFDGVEG
jgi:hypothetical protein